MEALSPWPALREGGCTPVAEKELRPRDVGVWSK